MLQNSIIINLLDSGACNVFHRQQASTMRASCHEANVLTILLQIVNIYFSHCMMMNKVVYKYTYCIGLVTNT